jgi:hypothetical protein
VQTLADPVRQNDHHTFLARADQARREADEATLPNVRERCLRSEATWRDMAARIKRTEIMRATLQKSKTAG